MSGPASIADAPWLHARETRALVAALETGEPLPAIRFVGGCVRNTLLGLEVEDIDLATLHSPEKVMELASAARLKCVATGIDHGTVTIIVEGKPFEVTTLRVDVKTTGRHAEVAFTEDWQADAERRDFTMNAIYADASGALFDPVGGVADLLAHRVRFIGDPVARIREDYLRILRFFRFHAWYGQGALDAAGLAACEAERQGLLRLSAERIQKELLRLIEAPDPVPSVEQMHESGILAVALSALVDIRALKSLVLVERRLNLADPVRRLAVLLRPAAETATLAHRLRFSNEMSDRLGQLMRFLQGSPLAPNINAQELRRLLYSKGARQVADEIILSWAWTGPSANAAQWKQMLDIAEHYVRPKLPVTGRDAMALGARGEKVGAALDAVEAWWIENDFAPDREMALAKLRAILSAPPPPGPLPPGEGRL